MTNAEYKALCAEHGLRYRIVDGEARSPTRSRKNPHDHLWCIYGDDGGQIGVSIRRETVRRTNNVKRHLSEMGVSWVQEGEREANGTAPASAAREIGALLLANKAKTGGGGRPFRRVTGGAEIDSAA